MHITHKQITTLLCSLAFLFCFADGLSAQQITAKTKSGYSSEVEFLDVVGDSLQFKNEEGKTLTLPLKDFAKPTLVEIIIQNEKKNGTYGLKFKDLQFWNGGRIARVPGDLGDFGGGGKENKTDESLEQAIAKSTQLKIGPDEDSYELLKVFGVTGRKLVIERKDEFEGGPGQCGFELPSKDIYVDERPLSKFDEPSLILITTRFAKSAKENEKAAEMAKQTELEAAKREEEHKKEEDRLVEESVKMELQEDKYTPKTKFDHCVVTVDRFSIKQVHDNGTSYFLNGSDWLDQLGEKGWELVQVLPRLKPNTVKPEQVMVYYFKREK